MNSKRDGLPCFLAEAKNGATSLPVVVASPASVSDQGSARAENRFQNAAHLCGISICILSALVIAAWLLQMPLAAALTAGFWPTSLRAGVAWFAMGAGICFANTLPRTRFVRLAAAGSVIVVATISMWSIAEECGLSRLAVAARFMKTPEGFPAPAVFGMALPTAISILVVSIGLFAGLRIPDSWIARRIGALGLVSSSVNLIYLLALIQGAPLGAKGGAVPVTFLSAVSGVLAGAGLMMGAGRDQFPLRQFVGPSISARFLRTFLPVIFLLLITGELLHNWSVTRPWFNPVWHTVLATVAATWAILWAAHLSSRDLAQAEMARRRAEMELRDSRDHLDAKVQERTAELARLNEALRFHIAEQKEAEEGVRLLADAVESTHELVSITDQQNRFTFVNRAFLQTYGYTVDEILGKTPEFLGSAKNVRGIHDEILRQTFKGGWCGELINRRKDGSEFPVSLVTAQIKNADGKTLGLVGVARDMTEHQRAERKAMALSLLAHRLSAAMMPDQAGTIIMNIAWDLFECDAGFFQLCTPEGEDLIPVMAFDTIDDTRLRIPQENLPTPRGEIVDRVMKEGGQLINRTAAHELTGSFLLPFGATQRRSASLMFAPIRSDGRVLGVISVQSYTPRKYGPADLKLLQVLADHCGGALERIRVAEALRVAEGNYRSIFEGAKDGIFQTTPEAGYVRVNPACARMFGYESPAEMVSTGRFDSAIFVSPERWSELQRLIASENAVSEFEAECYRKDGKTFWINISGRVLKRASPDIASFEGIVRDITVRKQMENELRASGERFRQVVEHIREVFWITDPTKQEMIYVSPGYEEVWGRSRDSLRSDARSWLEAVHPEDRERVREAALTKQVRGNYQEVYRIVRPDGAIRWIEDRAFPLSNEHGEIYRIVGIAEDITVRAEAADILRESEARFRTLFEAAPIGIALHGRDGRYISVNRAYCEMLGYTEAQVLSRGARRLTHPLDVGAGSKLSLALLSGMLDHYEREKRYLANDGRTVWALSAASAVRYGNGDLRYIISMVVDVTERKRLRDELLEISAHERRRLGHDLHDGLGQYLSGISFKAKCLEEALRAESPPNATAAKELIGLINNAIGQTRSLARGLDPIEVEIGGLISAMENLVCEAGNSSSVKCHFHCDQQVIPLETSKAVHLFRIAQEGLNNALKHSGAREINVELAHRNGQVRLAIADDGAGFPVNGRGEMGLGLRTMKYRAESIGATLRINPQPKRGVMVECILPDQETSNNNREVA